MTDQERIEANQARLTEDMSTTGFLRLIRQDDGDICVFIVSENQKYAGV